MKQEAYKFWIILAILKNNINSLYTLYHIYFNNLKIKEMISLTYFSM